MSDYQQFLAERDKIDFLLQSGYRIRAVQENLDGAFVQFKKQVNGESETETLHITTADARKYFASCMLQQKQA